MFQQNGKCLVVGHAGFISNVTGTVTSTDRVSILHAEINIWDRGASPHSG
jgi:hypothetical protein